MKIRPGSPLLLSIFLGMLVLGLSLWLQPCHAAQPVMLGDIETGADSGFMKWPVVMEGRHYFVSGGRTWVSRGTPETTSQLPELRGRPLDFIGNRLIYQDAASLKIFEGDKLIHSVDGLPIVNSYPEIVMQTLRSRGLLFIPTSRGLWRSDGTPEGTFQLAPTLPYWAPMISTPDGIDYIVTANGLTEYWRSDGTAAGTTRSPVQGPWIATAPGGGNLYTTDGKKLWRSDGTPEGTVLLREFVLVDGSMASDRVPLIKDGFVYFAAQSDTKYPGRCDLWRTDGTPEGTVRLAPGNLDPASFSGGGVRAITGLSGGPLLYTVSSPGGRKLVSLSDGGTVETLSSVPTTSIDSPSFGAGYGRPAYSGSLHCRAWSDGRLYYDGGGLWVTDGTQGGTRRLTAEGTASGPSCISPRPGGGVWFHAYNSGGLWNSDGTVRGTSRIADLAPSPMLLAYRQVSQFHETGGKLVFPGKDTAHGVEPWITDGTAAGTRLLVDAVTATRSAFPGNSYGSAVSGGRLFLPRDTSTGKIWSTDGTAAGTGHFADLPGTPNAKIISGVPGFGEDFFVISGSSPSSLWRSNGSVAGVQQVQGVQASSFLSTATKLLYAGQGTIYASSGGGTAPEVVAVVGDSLASVTPAAAAGGLCYFVVSTADVTRIWRSDGSSEGTFPIKDFTPDVKYYSLVFCPFGQRMLFSQTGADALWITAGAPDSTRKLQHWESPDSYLTPQLFASDDRIYAIRRDPASNRYVIWAGDGTPGAMKLLPAAYASGGTFFEGDFYFSGKAGPDAAWGLTRSDGTAAGTVGLQPGTVSEIWRTGGHLVFYSGGALYSIDGSGSAPAFLADLTRPGQISRPAHVTLLGENLVFTAEAPGYGRELFTLPVTPAAIRRAWEEKWFSGNGAPGAALSGADPDHDGVVNLLERAFGTEPIAATGPLALEDGQVMRRGLPAVLPPAAPGSALRAAFIRQRDWQTSGLRYTVHFSADLSTWYTAAQDGLEVAATDSEAELCTLPFPLLRRGAARFFRIEVTAE